MKLFPVLAAGLVLGSLHGAASASAATEFGSTCTTNTAGSAVTILQTAPATGSQLPATAPTTGVIVRWKISLIPGEFALPHVLKVLRAAGPKQFQVMADSAPGTVVPGANSFETRLPVQAGDLLGLYGITSPPGTLACGGVPGAKVATLAGNPPAGSTATTVEEVSEVGGGVSAVIEPDVDKDGFGDESQDKCPQSAATQVECPVVLLDSFALARRGSVVVAIGTSTATNVSVSASANVPGKGKAKSSALVKLKPQTKPATPGKLALFTLKFPSVLKAALLALPPAKSINLKIVASVTDVAGRVTTHRKKLKLRGQGG